MIGQIKTKGDEESFLARKVRKFVCAHTLPFLPSSLSLDLFLAMASRVLDVFGVYAKGGKVRIYQTKEKRDGKTTQTTRAEFKKSERVVWFEAKLAATVLTKLQELNGPGVHVVDRYVMFNGSGEADAFFGMFFGSEDTKENRGSLWKKRGNRLESFFHLRESLTFSGLPGPVYASAAWVYTKKDCLNLLLVSNGVNSVRHTDPKAFKPKDRYRRHSTVVVVDRRSSPPKVWQLDPLTATVAYQSWKEKKPDQHLYAATRKIAESVGVHPSCVNKRLLSRQSYSQDCVFQCLSVIEEIASGSSLSQIFN